MQFVAYVVQVILDKIGSVQVIQTKNCGISYYRHYLTQINQQFEQILR